MDLEKELSDIESVKRVGNQATPDTQADDDEDFDVIETDDDGNPIKAEKDGDERLSADQRDDEDEREAIREARRKERKEKRERQRQARDRSQAEMEALRRKVAAMEASLRQREAGELDDRLTGAARAYHAANEAIQRGAQGPQLAAALEQRDRAQAAYNQLRTVKERVMAAPAQAEPAADPRVIDNAHDFLERHSWIDLDGNDEASVIARSIDDALAKEGSDPASEEHWVELERRLRKRLPEKFQDDRKAGRQAGPPVGSGRQYAPPSTRKEVYVSPERKQAMISAGAWDDPSKRKAMLKRYAEWDKQNAAR